MKPYCLRAYRLRSKQDLLTGAPRLRADYSVKRAFGKESSFPKRRAAKLASQAGNLGWHLLSTEEWLQLARLTPRPPTLQEPSISTCWQWRKEGQPLKLMNALHGQVRKQVKKSQMDNFNYH